MLDPTLYGLLLQVDRDEIVLHRCKDHSYGKKIAYTG
jgi:hypothetical protein